MKRTFLILSGMMLCGLASAEEIRLAITADNSIAAHDKETENNMGKAPRVKLKGIENIILLNFDAAPLKGKSITKATLHIKATAKNVMVRKVGFSTVATEWSEGANEKDDKGKAGDSCFKFAALPDKAWAGAGSCFLDAVHGRGGTIWSQSFVSIKPDDWFAMEFDGRMLEACAAGLSYGIAVSDDNGQTKASHKDVVPDTNHSNNFFYSREQNNSAPYITVEAINAPKTEAKPLELKAQPWSGGADFETGGLEISWPGPVDAESAKAILGYRVFVASQGAEKELPRWMAPGIAQPGEMARALLKRQPAGAEVSVRVEVVTRGGNVSATGTTKGNVSSAFVEPAKLDLGPPKGGPRAAPPPSNEHGVVWVLPDCAKANPITGNVLEEVDYEGEPAGAYSNGNVTWNSKNQTVELRALRGEWVGYQIVCQNAKDAGTWKIQPAELKGPDGATIPATAVRLSKLWYQKLGKPEQARAWYADPMLPLAAGEAFKIPDEKNAVPGQKNQTVYVEFFVPKDARPGAYTGSVSVSANDAPVELKVVLSVGSAVIPDTARFTWSMNTYHTPGRIYGAAGSDEFLAAERSFYIMSHEHRTNIAVLNYSHSGRFEEGIAWPLTGKGKDMKVSDWAAWDKRFGPLFDGSAFKGTPREGVPMDHFYLPFMENYPTTMEAGYKWNDVKWDEHWKIAGTVDEGFSQDYKDQFVAVMKDFIKHVKEKGWKTNFQVYLNDKYFYKQYDDKKKAFGKGTSFWLLDEPQHIDDFTALAFFGKLIRQGQGADRGNVHHRVDVSRPQWGRDTLDRVVDLNVTGGFANYRPWLEDWRERHKQIVWTYGGAPSSQNSALGIVAQALDLYGRGVDGFVPWQTLGSEANWTKFEDTCVYYTGKPMGINGACASLRLKAYRRGEQDVEYVGLLATKLGLLKNDPNRLQVGRLLGGAIRATKKLGTLDAQGAVTESFSGLKPEDFENLRMAIASRLP